MDSEDLYNRSSLATGINATPEMHHTRLRADAVALVGRAMEIERHRVASALYSLILEAITPKE